MSFDKYKYLIFSHDGFVSCPSSSYLFHEYNGGENDLEIFKNFYKLIKSKLDAKFNSFETDSKRFGISSEMDFDDLEKIISITPYFSIIFFMDYNVYTYSNNRLDILSLERSICVHYIRSPKSYGNLKHHILNSISLNFEHHLFSNHISTAETFGTIEPEFLYFEPAAKLNRLLIRNFAFEIKNIFPDLTIEFSAYKTRIRPYDNYGFLENADYVISPED